MLNLWTQAIFRGIQELQAELSAAPAVAALQDHIAGQPDLQVGLSLVRLCYQQRASTGLAGTGHHISTPHLLPRHRILLCHCSLETFERLNMISCTFSNLLVKHNLLCLPLQTACPVGTACARDVTRETAGDVCRSTC